MWALLALFLSWCREVKPPVLAKVWASFREVNALFYAVVDFGSCDPIALLELKICTSIFGILHVSKVADSCFYRSKFWVICDIISLFYTVRDSFLGWNGEYGFSWRFVDAFTGDAAICGSDCWRCFSRLSSASKYAAGHCISDGQFTASRTDFSHLSASHSCPDILNYRELLLSVLLKMQPIYSETIVIAAELALDEFTVCSALRNGPRNFWSESRMRSSANLQWNRE